MAKILVVYSSKGGNTKALAEEIAKGADEVRGMEVVVKRAGEVTNEDLLSIDGLIVGSPVYFGGMSSEVKEMFDRSVTIRRKLEGKIGASFATSGHPTGGKETTMLSILQAMLIHGMVVIGDPISAGGHYGVGTVGSPDREAQMAGRELGQRVARLSKILKGEDYSSY
ncbi:NAD(P)H-dependent oxidoreductase [bacterium]|nr:NAD(P)H-dependent oxidoreductase [bacterium]MBU0900265.1 NAD(P)H-dependent oxidoreductase [bacterium]MBU1152865.1 NAD(P)H-dependent oxidoreductase [bacterium]MBU2600185.1 NAD(P)H-dependent oxidoreductase [bacterium]